MKARKIKRGDTIGVIASSEPVTDECMEDIKRAEKMLNSLGVNVKYAPHTFENPTGYGEIAKNKAHDINLMFADKSVNAIFCAIRWI